MLIVTRRKGDRIFIGPNIIITVAALGDGKVKLGFEAPQTVSIRRAELDKPEEQHQQERRSK